MTAGERMSMKEREREKRRELRHICRRENSECRREIDRQTDSEKRRKEKEGICAGERTPNT